MISGVAGLISKVRADLTPDYPRGTSFAWLHNLAWRGPVTVSTRSISQETGPTEWSLARRDTKKLAREARLVRSGDAKAVLLVKTPGSSKLFALNGHSRIIVCSRMNRPVKAIIGLAKTDHGPWEKHRSSSHDTTELSARTGMLASTPAPYGKLGGPGLYHVKGNKHSDYFEQVVRALMTKRGMSAAQASRVAWGALRKWRRGGGRVHPEVRAAAATALGQEDAARAKAHSASHEDVIDLAGFMGMWNPQLHPRAWHGRFGPSGRQQQMSQRSASDPEDRHLREMASAFRQQASADRMRARGLYRQAKTLMNPPSRPVTAASAAASAAAKKAAATRAARGIAPFTPSGKALKKGTKTTTTTVSVNQLTAEASNLMRRAMFLDQRANMLDHQALV